jgi:DNA-binding CsgD family transcriptional regulator
MTDPRTCGVLAGCGRWAHHRGHHGGFRVVDGIPPQLSEPTEARLARHPALSVREVEVLLELMEGQGAKAVAGRLGMSEQTIKNHLTGVYRKLDVSGLVGAYRRLGWLSVRPAEARRIVAEGELREQVDQAVTVLQGIQRELVDDSVPIDG